MEESTVTSRNPYNCISLRSDIVQIAYGCTAADHKRDFEMTTIERDWILLR